MHSLKFMAGVVSCIIVTGTAGAQTLLASNVLVSNSVGSGDLGPGVYGGGSTWYFTYPSNYSYYAGQIDWIVNNTSTAGTLCSSFTQEFGVGSSFNVDMYSLKNATAAGITGLLPASDAGTPNYSAANFLAAGELFGADYAAAVGDANKLAALQISVWDAEYGLGPANQPLGTVVDTTLASLVTADLAQLGSLNSSDLNNVVWWDAGINGGQGQFQYVPGTPGAVPEPFTMSLGAAGIGLALRRRARKLAA